MKTKVAGQHLDHGTSTEPRHKDGRNSEFVGIVVPKERLELSRP